MNLVRALVRWWRGSMDPQGRDAQRRAAEERENVQAEQRFRNGASTRVGGG